MSVARVPFALIGVVLLVGSATFAGSLGAPTAGQPDVDRAMDRTESATQSAVRDAVTTAAVAAARNPVTHRASTPTGRVLSRGSTFRDALRLRIYVAVRDRLDRISRRQGDVTVTASVPATPTAGDLDDAMARVSVERDGTDLRATVENVTLTARRNGRVVGRRTISPTVTVPVPTLAVHDRVERFERRLNGGPAERGLGGRLTAQLYALTWIRGYAQYGGAPIENVLANRHIGLLTNSNVLTMQREHFGASDPRGRSVLQWAVADTAITDAIRGSEGRVASYLSELKSHEKLDRLPATVLSRRGATTPSPAASDSVTVAVNDTADRAFLRTLDGLNDTIESAYQTEVQLRQRVLDRTDRTLHEPREPDPDWELVAVRRDADRSVRPRQSPPPDPDGPWHVFEHYPRRVVLETTVERVWNTSDGHVETVEISETRADVLVALVGRHDGGPAPTRGVDPVHKPGGPLDGPNLRGVGEKARERLIGRQDVDNLAVDAVRSDGTTTTATVTGELPAGIYAWVYADLVRLREEVRDLSITVERGKLATFQVNPARRLRAKLHRRRADLLDLPDTYSATPDRARANARVAYLRAVRTRLTERARAHEKSREEIADELEDRDLRSLDAMQRDYERKGSASDPQAPDLPMRVEAAPSYLTLGELDGNEVARLPPGRATHPLVARNVNLITVPYGDLASGITRMFLGPERVRLQTAIQVLRTARRFDASTSNASVDAARIEAGVEDALGYLSWQASLSLASSPAVPATDGAAVVEAALRRWKDPVELGQAWLDGAAVDAIHAEATRRWDLSDVQSDRLRVRLETGTALALDSSGAQPPKPAVNDTVRTFKDEFGGKLSDEVADRLRRGSRLTIEELTGRTLSRLPAGLPLAPPVAPWYLTVNYWQVQVRGEYSRFAVSVPRGTPDTPGARFQYVRDTGTVSLDVDGDGSRERLGQTTRVRFRTHTSVAIAVPPGPRGVGDVDGNRDERSPGWPDPG